MSWGSPSCTTLSLCAPQHVGPGARWPIASTLPASPCRGCVLGTSTTFGWWHRTMWEPVRPLTRASPGAFPGSIEVSGDCGGGGRVERGSDREGRVSLVQPAAAHSQTRPNVLMLSIWHFLLQNTESCMVTPAFAFKKIKDL